jgi:hypothetical protein
MRQARKARPSSRRTEGLRRTGTGTSSASVDPTEPPW